jgi:hypothetical protein
VYAKLGQKQVLTRLDSLKRLKTETRGDDDDVSSDLQAELQP